jgi:RloB-like protein
VTIAEERGVPATLVDLAVAAKAEAAREERRGRGSAWDDIWCVFDEDSHPNVPEAISKAEAHGINLAVSSPCIELWFILHFQDQTAFIERRNAQSCARRLTGCDKRLSDDAVERLGEHYDDARRRARALDEKHAGDGSAPRSNPSSEVWKLVDRISNSS